MARVFTIKHAVVAGRGACDQQIVSYVVRNGPSALAGDRLHCGGVSSTTVGSADSWS